MKTDIFRSRYGVTAIANTKNIPRLFLFPAKDWIAVVSN